MSNLTVSVDEHLIKLARMRAIEQGTSLSAKVREFLQAYVGGKGSHGGYCGPAVKPIALNMVAEIARA